MYDANKSYLQNYIEGPNPKLDINHCFPKIEYKGTPKFSFLGVPLFIPFGVPAGPLLNSKFVKVALDAGFCLPTYKTVRSNTWESHPWPNVLKIKAESDQIFSQELPIVIGKTFSPNDYQSHDLSISNSFGVPSQHPEIWSKDFASLKPYANNKGLHVVLSFQGSHSKNHNLYTDIERTCEYAAEASEKTGFYLLEINLSCPNEVNEPIYKSLKDSVHALKAAHTVLSNFKNIKLIAKIGALTPENTYAFVSEVSPYVHALSAINTVLAKIVDPSGHTVLGSQSLTGGVCGNAILKQGLMMCENLAAAREKCGLNSNTLGLIGVGGVASALHFKNYRDAGADVVQAATGMMWNLNLAQEIAQILNISFDEVNT